MNNSIPKQVLNGLGELGVETLKEGAKQAGEIVYTAISGKEWLGNINQMSDEELSKEKQNEERKKQEEMAELRKSMGQGRDIESEITQLRREEESEEEQIKRQEERQKEEENRQWEMQQNQMPTEIQGKKGRGNPNAGKQKPQKSDMSQTQEFVKKPN